MRLDPALLQRCWFLVGPTACGKTALGIALAEHLGAEILSLDSMAIFRGMDIGTAKPTAAQQRRVPHHLIDLVDPSSDFSVAEYLEHAETICRQIEQRGRTPLFVGGTGLYLRSLLRGLFEGPGRDAAIRVELEETARRDGPQSLYERLREVDPPTAARLHPNDVRRVIRALEVVAVTGRPLSSFHREGPLTPRPPHVYRLAPPRDWLCERIDRRVDQMIEQGLLAETEHLLACPGGLGQTARQALGYREMIDLLEGNQSWKETTTLIKRRTRQFAKRQETWFRNLEECRTIAMTGDETPEELMERILNDGKNLANWQSDRTTD